MSNSNARRPARRSTRRFAAGLLALVGANGLFLLLGSGCGENQTVTAAIELDRDLPPGSTSIALRARVVGLENGVTYKWFSAHGQCVPQESDTPETVFKFGSGALSDRVSLGVWHLGHLVAQSHVDVALDRSERPRTSVPPPRIEMMDTPPFDPTGLLETRHHISGRVTGEVEEGLMVVIYGRNGSDDWRIQPNMYENHPLHSDHTWSTWTHGGSSYAVLLVRSEYVAPPTTGALPAVGSGVLARLIVESGRKP